MDIIYAFDEIIKDTNSFVTVGTFDGLHVGHRRIIEKLKESASSVNGRSVVVTFSPHPRTVFKSSDPVKLITTLEEKIELFNETGIDVLWIINFTKEFASLTSEEFVSKYLVERLGMKGIIIGHDHRFGKGRDGDEQKLNLIGKQYGFTVTSVEAVSVNGENASSSKIRRALSEGDIKLAELYLGRRYSFRGEVIVGERRGRLLGFPTANVGSYGEDKQLPANGVYAVKVKIEDRTLNGVINIGKRPTFKDDDIIIPEVHILDFNEDVYGKKIEVIFVERIRGEVKFSSKEELIEQINTDKKISIKILKVIN